MAKTILLEVTPEQLQTLFMAVIVEAAIRDSQITGDAGTWFKRPLNIPGLVERRDQCRALEDFLRARLP